MDIFAEWQRGGTELRWRSTTAANEGREVGVFSRRCGTAGAPPLVLVHGFATSSIDYFALQTLGNQPDGAVLVDQSAP